MRPTLLGLMWSLEALLEVSAPAAAAAASASALRTCWRCRRL
jgi:hypothetical protein